MSDNKEIAKPENNQELHAMESACRLLREAAVELTRAKLPGAATLIRNSANNLARSIAAARHEAQVERMKGLLVLADKGVKRVTDYVGAFGPSTPGCAPGDELLIRPPARTAGPANFGAPVEGGGGCPSAAARGEAIYSADVLEKKATASGGSEETTKDALR